MMTVTGIRSSRRKAKFEELFGHLEIGRKPTGERNSYMVLRLNFSTVQVNMDMAKLERNFASDCLISLASFLRQHSAYFVGRVQLDPALPSADHMKSILTAVLPITMDDMTSGFNIAENVSLKLPLHNMMGFTQAEVDGCLENVLADYTLDRAMFPAIQRIMKDYYNGYRFLLEAPDMIDPNVKTDVSWIERLGFGEGTPLALMQELLQKDGRVEGYDEEALGLRILLTQETGRIACNIQSDNENYHVSGSETGMAFHFGMPPEYVY